MGKNVGSGYECEKLFSQTHHMKYVQLRNNANLDVPLWVSLNFNEIDKSLARRLTDDDLGAMLATINAVKTLRRLNINGCTGISGIGLEPLFGSIVLNEMNLSTLHDNSTYHPLSEEAVLPILDSIIIKDDRSLTNIEIPSSWDVEQIKNRFNQIMIKPSVRFVSKKGCKKKDICGQWSDCDQCCLQCAHSTRLVVRHYDGHSCWI